MRILGLDVGDTLIGVAVSDPMKIIAQGLDSIRRNEIREDIKSIKSLVDKYEVEKIVVGLPKTMNDEIGIQAQKVLDFVKLLRAEVNVPVIMEDERLTTVVASRSLIEANMKRRKRKKTVDKVAAVLILQGYLDAQAQKQSHNQKS